MTMSEYLSEAEN